ncbi:MAG: cytochrome P460 family protein [Planctomycetota bacterium]|nr:cytochrome P460 family protein [Planctomycetota bacterium]
MNLSLRRFATLALASALTLSACKSLGTPEEQTRADDLYNEIADYKSWGNFEGFEGFQIGDSVHGRFVRVYANGIAEANQQDLPYESIIVKENFDKEDEGALTGITVMQRLQGVDPEHNDWFWVRYSPSGTQTHSGKPAFCIDCHSEAEGDDYVFLND